MYWGWSPLGPEIWAPAKAVDALPASSVPCDPVETTLRRAASVPGDLCPPPCVFDPPGRLSRGRQSSLS